MIIVQIAGRLGRKPETRFTPSGQKVTSFSVATNVRKAGKEETVWWRVTVWGDRYDKMMTYLDKG
ncbi:MAG: single-stranded DNA-binding protein, partial [Parachlamydiaceae bacterium]